LAKVMISKRCCLHVHEHARLLNCWITS